MPSDQAGFAQQFAQTLNRTERFVLMLHYAEELTIDEISQVLDVPEHRVFVLKD